MSYEMIALLMFASMVLLLVSGQRVFAAIGFVASGAALLLYGQGAIELPFNQVFKLFNWYAMLTLPMFIYGSARFPQKLPPTLALASISICL